MTHGMLVTCKHGKAAGPAFAAVEGQLGRAKLPTNDICQAVSTTHEGYDHHSNR